MNAQGYRSLLEDERARLIELRDGLAEAAVPEEVGSGTDPGAGGHLADAGSGLPPALFARHPDVRFPAPRHA